MGVVGVVLINIYSVGLVLINIYREKAHRTREHVLCLHVVHVIDAEVALGLLVHDVSQPCPACRAHAGDKYMRICAPVTVTNICVCS